MHSTCELLNSIRNGAFDTVFANLYGSGAVKRQRERYAQLVHAFTGRFGEKDEIYLFSAPGRTELGGNHTDHNHGQVLAAAIDLDVIAAVSPCAEPRIRMKSRGYHINAIDLNDLSVQPGETGRSASLIRGTAARFTQLGLNIGGFDAFTTSNVPQGSGLSSSAAFEVIVGTILNSLYNNSSVPLVDIAKIACYAENVYFGKPSGLMDQMASAVGGIITIDFENAEAPVIEKIDFDFSGCGHCLYIVDVGSNHADLTHEYAAVPAEMKAVAAALGTDTLRETSYRMLLPRIPELRRQLGDRAILRALHFFAENSRVKNEAAALRNGDFELFKKLIIESGHSSFEYLQNVYVNSKVTSQNMSLPLALAQQVLNGRGAWRVHGGGFGGTIQSFVPDALVNTFTEAMEPVFGAGSCHSLSIRPRGGIEITEEPC